MDHNETVLKTLSHLRLVCTEDSSKTISERFGFDTSRLFLSQQFAIWSWRRGVF